MKTLLIIILVITFNKAIYSEIYEDYYWREYKGVIPKDAFVAGKDRNGYNIYIGQAFFQDIKHSPTFFPSLSVVEIHPGIPDVQVLYRDKVYQVNTSVKIFCTKVPEKFYWLRSTAATLDLDLIEKQPVVGGQGGYVEVYPYFIGRIADVYTTKIGRIFPTSVEFKNLMYYIHENTGQKASAYEILLYNNVHNDNTTTSSTASSSTTKTTQKTTTKSTQKTSTIHSTTTSDTTIKPYSTTTIKPYSITTIKPHSTTTIKPHSTTTTAGPWTPFQTTLPHSL